MKVNSPREIINARIMAKKVEKY